MTFAVSFSDAKVALRGTLALGSLTQIKVIVILCIAVRGQHYMSYRADS